MAQSIAGSWHLDLAGGSEVGPEVGRFRRRLPELEGIERKLAARQPQRPVGARRALAVAALCGAVAGLIAGAGLTAVAMEPLPRVARAAPVKERAVSAVDWSVRSTPRSARGTVRYEHMYLPRR